MLTIVLTRKQSSGMDEDGDGDYADPAAEEFAAYVTGQDEE